MNPILVVLRNIMFLIRTLAEALGYCVLSGTLLMRFADYEPEMWDAAGLFGLPLTVILGWNIWKLVNQLKRKKKTDREEARAKKPLPGLEDAPAVPNPDTGGRPKVAPWMATQ